MSENKVNGLMSETLQKIKATVDVDTIIGKEIVASDGTIIIPISKLNYGFASGGSDIPSKHQTGLFAGGAGGAVTVAPIGFLVVKNGNVKFTQIEPFNSSIDRLIQQAPDFIDKITNLFKKDEEETSEEEN
ncbi:MAG: spore germination protein GerW family protein [Clostridia bacterium]